MNQVSALARNRPIIFHVLVLIAIGLMHFWLPPYYHGQVARILVLAVYAMGYNILFGYTGLLSLGHAMFFAAGMYGMGLSVKFLSLDPASAFVLGLLASLIFTAIVGIFALRTSGVAFMIVTLMFSQAAYLTILHFGEWTRGDEGFNIKSLAPLAELTNIPIADLRYFAAFILFGIAFIINHVIVQARGGRVMIGVRENEERTRMLGYNVWAVKYRALLWSGLFAGASGAAYALLFGYVGATFATVTYSIYPLLYVLVGGAGVVLGPLVGTAFMVFLVDFASGQTEAYMIVVGVVLLVVVLFARAGLLGLLRKKVLPWLP